ncbi:MAG: hypothetical protein IV100_29500 [Myxococcales bacterium]|nr:hypothetical protein [Myxococcales bacterium]
MDSFPGNTIRLARVGRVVGLLLIILACAALALTLVSPIWPLAVALVGVMLVVPHDQMKIAIGFLAIIPTGFLALRTLNFGVTAVAPPVAGLAAGQYDADSPDLLGLVHVRAVIRAPALPAGTATLILVDAHAPPWLGFDDATLKRESQRALEAQGVPAAPSPASDPGTAHLVHGALARALASTPTSPELPDGATQQGAIDTYYAMFPQEFAHTCDFSKLPSGSFEGTSSNPGFPARVRITVVAGTLKRVEVLDSKHSDHGRPAFETLPAKMVEQNRADVDVVAGATRSSWILRSAVFHACKAGLASVKGPAKAPSTAAPPPQ